MYCLYLGLSSLVRLALTTLLLVYSLSASARQRPLGWSGTARKKCSPVFIAVDIDLFISFFVELYAVRSEQLSQSLTKLLKYMTMVYQFGIQSTLYEASVLGSGAGRGKRPNLEWVMQTMYFFMCPPLFVVLIVAALSICRDKPRIIGRADAGLQLANHHSLTEGLALIFTFLLVLFAFFQYFLSTLSRYFQTDSLDSMQGMAIGGLAASALCLLVFYLRRHSVQ